MCTGKELSDGIFNDNVFREAKMNVPTPRDKYESVTTASSLNSSLSLRIHAVHCSFLLFSFVSDSLTKLKGHCQLGQKQSGSECICMSPEEDCR